MASRGAYLHQLVSWLLRTSWGRVAGLAALGVAAASCATDIDTERVAPARGTIGEEVYEVVCQRFAADAYPNDVSGSMSRDLCEGRVGPEAAPASDEPEAHARLVALAENRDRLVAAIDQVIPEDLGSPMNRLLVDMIPLYDPPAERLPEATRALADVLVTLSEDAEAVAALERLMHREGYRRLRNALGVARPALRYPELDVFLDTSLAAIDEGGAAERPWQDLLRAGAFEMALDEPDANEPGPSTLELTRDLLFTERAVFGAGEPLYMARRDPRGIVRPAGGVVADPFVDTDADGLADVDSLGRFVDADGTPLDVPAPFALLDEGNVARDDFERAERTAGGALYYDHVDLDATLLAGLAREIGPLVDPNVRGGTTVLDMMRGLPLLLGPVEEDKTATYGAATLRYTGHDTSRSALFDVLHGGSAVLDDADLPDVLVAVETLLRDREHEVAQVIEAGLYADALADDDTRADLIANAELWDDVIQVITWAAQEPGLLEDLLRALTDPRSRHLGQIFAEMMRHKDVIGADPADPHARESWRRDVVYSDEVDRGAANTKENHSIFQRTVSVIHDLNGVKVCNKEDPKLVVLGIDVTWALTPDQQKRCGLLQIDDIAEAYAQAITGDFELTLKSGLLQFLIDFLGEGGDFILEESSGIDGLTTTPEPEAFNRLVFEPTPFVDDLVDPPVTRDGVLVAERHDSQVVFAWERRYVFQGDTLITDPALIPGQGEPCPAGYECITFYEAMSPLLEAFYAHDSVVGEGPDCGHIAPGTEEAPSSNPCYLFSELLSALHLHWPQASDDTTQTDENQAFFARKSGGSSYEPLVADIFGDCTPDGSGGCTERGAGLITALRDLLIALDETEVRAGVDGLDALAAQGETLIDPDRNPGLTDRRGNTTTTTNAGHRTVPVTPLLLLLDGLNAMDDAFMAKPERHRLWLGGRELLVDNLLTATCDAGGPCTLDNQRVREALLVTLPFLRDRIAFHEDQGDLDAWAAGLSTDAEETLASPAGSALFDLADAIGSDDEARLQLAALVHYLISEDSPDEAFDNTVVATADMLQWLEDDANMDPFLKVISHALAPGARDRVDNGPADDELELDGSAADASAQLLREISALDDERTLREVLANLVSFPAGGRLETPLDVIVDVIAEVNRAPARLNEGTHLDPEDYDHALDGTVDFLANEHRGLERLYDVIQHRTLQGPPAP